MTLDKFRVVGRYNGNLLLRGSQPGPDDWITLQELQKSIGPITIYKVNSCKESNPSRERQRGFQVIQDEPSQQHPTEEWVRAAVATIKELLKRGNVFVHCKRGRDRTGFPIAAWRILECAWTVKAALEEYRSFGSTFLTKIWDHRMEECVRKLGAK